MRTIKFRAFVETHNGKEMVNDWCFLNEKDNHFHAVDLTNERSDIGEVYAVMQFTGLHDKNGKEIYEGDVVEHTNPQRGCIEYLEQYAAFVLVSEGIIFKPETATLVIGNIYENPELL